MSFLAELKRRNVFRVAGVYAVVAWLLAQVAVVLEAGVGLPGWFDGFVIALLVLGFPVAVVLAWAFELTPEGVKPTVAAPDGAPSPSISILDAGLLAVLVAVLGVSIYQATRMGPAANEASSVAEAAPTASDAAPEADTRISLAVLPFADMSPEGDQEYFSDGLSEELLNQLAHIEELRVISRTSSFAFKGRNSDAREIGETLGVGHLLEGSVRKSGDQLRITAQLIDATDGSHVWSDTYDRALSDVFTVQEDISEDVARELSVALGVGGSASDVGGTDSVEAYDAYLRGRARGINTVGAGPVVDIREAVEHLRRAVEIDPTFAKAWVELASNYAAGTFAAPTAELQAQAVELGNEAGDRAIELAPDMWESQVLRGWRLVSERRWVEADAAFARAQALADEAGAYMGSHRWAFLWETGRLEGALAYIENARVKDPLELESSGIKENIEYALGRRATPSDSNDGPSTVTRLAQAFHVGDASVVDAALANNRLPLAVALRDVWRSRDDALEVIRDRVHAPGYHPPLELIGAALLSGAYDDADLALELLRTAFIERNIQIGRSFMWLPQMADVRRTEEFKELMRDYGYVDLWRETGRWSDFCRPRGDDDFECF